MGLNCTDGSIAIPLRSVSPPKIPQGSRLLSRGDGRVERRTKVGGDRSQSSFSGGWPSVERDVATPL